MGTTARREKHADTGNGDRTRFADSISIHTEALDILLIPHEPHRSGRNHTPLHISARIHLATAIFEGARLVKKEHAVTGKAINRAVAEP